MGYVVGDLAGYQTAELHPVVAEAFADYIVPMQADAGRLYALLTRRGWEPAWSSGLFQAGRLVGFWLNGRDDSRTEAYCIDARDQAACSWLTLRRRAGPFPR